MMKKILSIFLLLTLICTLGACQDTTPKESIEDTKHLDYDFTLMTDEDLLRTIATREIFQNYAPDSDYSVEELMIASPEFKELLNRDTALENLKFHLPALIKEFPDSGIALLEDCLDIIEAYLQPDSATSIPFTTD